MSDIRIYPDPQVLYRAAADYFLSLAAACISENGLFSVVLSGGSTPRAVHQLLAEPKFGGKLNWNRIYIFWGDERCVPPEHQHSNYRMARETLLDHVPVTEENIYRIHGELPPVRAAELYEADLRSFFTERAGYGEISTPPVFDLVFLGMGEDGHTASLFPGSPDPTEIQRWVVPVEHHQPPAPLVDRVTLTPLLINAASHVVFLITGSTKAQMVARVIDGIDQPDVLPARAIQPSSGELIWMLDVDAARELN